MNNRPLETKYLFQQALPIMMGGFIQFVVNFTNTVFVGRLGELALNTVGNSGLLFITLFVVGQGFGSGVQILVARRLAQRKHRQVGWIAQHGFLLSVVGSILLLGIGQLIRMYLLQDMIADDVLRGAMSDFLYYRNWAFLVAIPNAMLMGYFTGLGKTAILGWSALITATANIALDYMLIYGKWGAPALGPNGAAIASTCAESLSFAAVVVYTATSKFQRKFELLRWGKVRFNLIQKLLRLSGPLIGQRFISLFAWTAFFFFIEKTGSQKLAVSQVIRNLYFLAFIPIFGFGSATGTVVSGLMAQKDAKGVMAAMVKIGWISTCVTFVFVHGYLFYPRTIVSLITTDPLIVEQSIPVLRLIVSSMLIHSTVMVLFNGVSGVGDTKWAFWIELVSIVIYLIYCYWVCIYQPQNLFVIWCAEFVYFGLLALFSWAYFKWSNWRTFEI